MSVLGRYADARGAARPALSLISLRLTNKAPRSDSPSSAVAHGRDCAVGDMDRVLRRDEMMHLGRAMRSIFGQSAIYYRQGQPQEARPEAWERNR
jgi:hypothetical protein